MGESPEERELAAAVETKLREREREGDRISAPKCLPRQERNCPFLHRLGLRSLLPCRELGTCRHASNQTPKKVGEIFKNKFSTSRLLFWYQKQKQRHLRAVNSKKAAASWRHVHPEMGFVNRSRRHLGLLPAWSLFLPLFGKALERGFQIVLFFLGIVPEDNIVLIQKQKQKF